MKTYKLLFVDDEKEIVESIISAVKTLLMRKDGIGIEYSVLDNREQIEKINDMPADVILFDCDLASANLDFKGEDEYTYGMELMNRFRMKNERTKLIFYSGSFKLEGTQCYDFTNEEMLRLINDLHIYKMIPKKVEDIKNAILETIGDLDAVTISLDELKYEYQSQGTFVVDDKPYSISQLIEELKKGTEIGEHFQKEVYKMTLSYLMKFGGDEE